MTVPTPLVGTSSRLGCHDIPKPNTHIAFFIDRRRRRDRGIMIRGDFREDQEQADVPKHGH
ncbi:MAG: hypothetical protein OXN80_09920, partial [bacterium]|nr:hypothetical protein [bacterium]